MSAPPMPRSVEASKALGNSLFYANRFQEAIAEYRYALRDLKMTLLPSVSTAVDANSGNAAMALLHNNIAMAHFAANEHQECLVECDMALALTKGLLSGREQQFHARGQHLKAAYRKCKCLVTVGRKQEARETLMESINLFGSSLASEQGMYELVKREYESLQREAVEQEYSGELLPLNEYGAAKNIRVTYKSIECGKVVLSKQKFNYGDTIFEETPLVCSVNVDSPVPCCAHCLRGLCGSGQLWQALDFGTLPNDLPPNSLPVSCPNCGEYYCSVDCMEAANYQHHGMLCSPKVEGRARFYPQLVQLAHHIGRTNPLVIARMFAMIVRKAEIDKDPTPNAAFDRFCQNPESHAHDAMVVSLIRSCVYSANPSLLQSSLDCLITLDMYRGFNGAIFRNASTLNPISSLHAYLEECKDAALLSRVWHKLHGIPPRRQQSVDQLRADILVHEKLYSICGKGTGLFAIHNMMNHSCEPSSASISRSLTSKLSVVALQPIAKDDEITISYIDESMPTPLRQAVLAEKYMFRCACGKCKARK